MEKERLLSYRDNREEIKELKYILSNRWKEDCMIGNDVIFDYSKGYPMPQSVVGFDRERYERLQKRDLKRKEYLERENRELEYYVEKIKDSKTRRIFRAYFIDGRERPTQFQLARKFYMDQSRISRKIDDYLKNA